MISTPSEFLKLRLLEESDLECLVRWRNDPETRFNFFDSSVISESEQSAWYQKYLLRPTDRVFIMVHNDYTRTGTVSLYRIDYRNRSAELGRVMVAPEHRRNGFSGCAIEGLVQYARRSLGLHRIQVSLLAGNTAAEALYSRCGFNKEGVLVDAVWSDGEFKDVIVMGRLL